MTWQSYDARIWRQYDVISTLMCPLGNYFYYSLNQMLQPKIAYCTQGLHDAILFVRWSWCLNTFFKVQMKTKKTRSSFKSSDLEEREYFCGNETWSVLEMIELSVSSGWTTHWGRVTHICVGSLTIIGPENGLSPGRRQAIIWTNAGILLIGPWGTNFSEILIDIQTFSFKKMSSAK